MTYLFIDESGDIGLKKGSSVWFVITLLVTRDRAIVDGLIEGIRTTMEANRDRPVRELHAHRARDWVRADVLAGLAAACADCKVFCVALNKQALHDQLRTKGRLLYDYAVDTLLDHLHAAKLIPPEEDIELVIDEHGANAMIRRKFEHYVDENLEAWGPGGATVRARPSYADAGLQAVDFISWALFRKYEHGDTHFYDMIKSNIADEHIIPSDSSFSFFTLPPVRATH